MTPRPLVLVVGNPSERRDQLAQTLIARDRAVVICNGPPGCPLIRGDHCPVVDVADLTVVLEDQTSIRETAVGLALCATSARRSVSADVGAGRDDIVERIDAALASN